MISSLLVYFLPVSSSSSYFVDQMLLPFGVWSMNYNHSMMDDSPPLWASFDIPQIHLFKMSFMILRIEFHRNDEIFWKINQTSFRMQNWFFSYWIDNGVLLHCYQHRKAIVMKIRLTCIMQTINSIVKTQLQINKFAHETGAISLLALSKTRIMICQSSTARYHRPPHYMAQPHMAQ